VSRQIHADSGTPNILREAESLTSGDRHDDYGSAEQNWACTVRLWNAFIANHHQIHGHIKLTPADGLQMMVLAKMAREQFKHKRDNCTDGAGYWRLVSVVNGDEEEKV